MVGQGQPYSRSQMTTLLRHAMFSPIHWSEELFMPPIPSAMMLRAAPALERIGAALSLPFAGVHVIEATKLLYRPVAGRSGLLSDRPASGLMTLISLS